LQAAWALGGHRSSFATDHAVVFVCTTKESGGSVFAVITPMRLHSTTVRGVGAVLLVALIVALFVVLRRKAMDGAASLD